jgi:pyridinium-3,5-biscarboxylic acid mononucleotide sulfurtransferase
LIARPDAKEQHLETLLAGVDSAIVAFSGGVDSAYLGWVATRVLGSAALCVTADSPSYPDHHRQLALRTARECGLYHEVIRTAELERVEYRENPVNRCYYCKRELYTELSALARQRGFAVVLDGNNADDRGDYRPGRQAAREFGVRSLLDEAGLTKTEIRELSRRAGLPTWDEPASACLSSRIPYHSPVTTEKLRMIERAEAALRRLGFRLCRVRHHEPNQADLSAVASTGAEAGLRDRGSLARVEVGRTELGRALTPDVRARIVDQLTDIGYAEVVIDPKGYRMGSLNEGVRLDPV